MRTAGKSISISTFFTTQMPLNHCSEAIAEPVIAEAD